MRSGPSSSVCKILDLCGFQTGKLDEGECLGALQRAQQLVQLIAGLVGTVGSEEQAAPPREATHQIVQQREGPRVGPMHIVDEDRDRHAGRCPLDQYPNRLEHSGPFQPGVAEGNERRHPDPIEEPRQIGQALNQCRIGDRTQRLHDGGARQVPL
jgi:hypothetical protein